MAGEPVEALPFVAEATAEVAPEAVWASRVTVELGEVTVEAGYVTVEAGSVTVTP